MNTLLLKLCNKEKSINLLLLGSVELVHVSSSLKCSLVTQVLKVVARWSLHRQEPSSHGCWSYCSHFI
ncbi:unnamed protein product [Brassica rapa subsp. narinosa]